MDALFPLGTILENGAKQSILFKEWSNSRIIKDFFEIENCVPEQRNTNDLCSESFELPKEGDWYIVWEDDSITILEKVYLVSVEPELVKKVYVQTLPDTPRHLETDETMASKKMNLYF